MKVSIEIELHDEADPAKLLDRIEIAAHGAVQRARLRYSPEMIAYCPTGTIFLLPCHDPWNKSSSMVVIGKRPK